jgi:hypothetical protein
VIDSYSDDGTGWARFSDDEVMRYRLARSLTLTRLVIADGIVQGLARIVWLMLNPSTADAFQLDPTVNECRKRSIAMGGDVYEVVNLFALRSPYPADLQKRAAGYRGDDIYNNEAILSACFGAKAVIAAWGNHGALGGRDQIVRANLRDAGIPLQHLGLTDGGYPKHPLARGKHRIPADLQPVVWEAA